MLLDNLTPPTIIEHLDYEAIVARKLARVKEILSKKGIEYKPSEADDLMTLIEADAYEEMLLVANTNERIKSQFLAFAQDSDLDHIATTRFGVERLGGIKPTARVLFVLSSVLDIDVVLPKGMMLGNGVDTAYLVESVTIKAGETQTVGVVRLDEEIRSKDVKTETILTPISWVIKAKQLEKFDGGADMESDARYRERVWLSRHRRTTAGSKMMYVFYTKSADVRVKEVNVKNGGAGVVDVCYHAEEDITDIVRSYLNGEEIRPLTDSVHVQKAVVKNISIEAELVARDMALVDLDATKRRFAPFEQKFDTFLSVAKIYDLLGDENIVDVELKSPLTSIQTDFNEVLRFEFSLGVRSAS